MTRTTRRTVIRGAAATLTSAALLLGTSACGEDKPDATKLSADAKASSTSAKSVSLDIVGDVNGTKTTMTVSGAMSGANQKQIQTQGDARSEGLIIGKDAYLKGNTKFWQQIGSPAASAAKLNDTWWKGEPTDSSSNPAVDVKKLLTTFFGSAEGKKLAAKDAKVDETTTNGTDTYTISDPKASGNAKLIVERGGKHRVVKIENYSSDITNTKASYTFTKWDGVETYKAPSGAKPIKDALGG